MAGTGSKVQGSIDRLQATLDNLDKSMKNIESITEHIDKGEGTVGHLVNDDTIARNVEDITENASTFVRGITKLQTIVGLRTEYNVLASTVKNYLSISLMPRPDKFYLIELVEDPRGYSNTVTTATVSSRDGFVSNTTVTTTDQLRFSLMFGKRVGAGGRPLRHQGVDRWHRRRRVPVRRPAHAVDRRLQLRGLERCPVPARARPRFRTTSTARCCT